jgi:hypothetical protein
MNRITVAAPHKYSILYKTCQLAVKLAPYRDDDYG